MGILLRAAVAVLVLASPIAAYAQETSQSLAAKIVAASDRAGTQGTSIAVAVNETIETSGATPIVISAAINSLLTQCPSGEMMRELMRRPGAKIASFCAEDAQTALRSLRSTALAQAGATGATGATGGIAGAGLPSAPSGSAAGGGSDYQPVGG